MPVRFSPKKLEETSFWIREFREDWNLEVPIRIHGFGVDDGHGLGSPPFHPEFEHFVGPICFCGKPPTCDPLCYARDGGRHLSTCDPGCPSERRKGGGRRNPESRLRTTRAFRKLRKVAPREFDALHLMCRYNNSFESARQALNERAARLDKPERYDPTAMMVLVVSGVDKVKTYW